MQYNWAYDRKHLKYLIIFLYNYTLNNLFLLNKNSKNAIFHFKKCILANILSHRIVQLNNMHLQLKSNTFMDIHFSTFIYLIKARIG